MSYESLFKPIRIGTAEIKNRIGLAPMNLNFTKEGYVSEQQLAYYAARAKGGCGLIMTEAVRTSEEDTRRTFYDNAHLWTAAHQKGLSILADTIHGFDAKIIVQVNIGPGPQGSSKKAGLQPRAASPVGYEVPREKVPKAMLPRIEKGVIYMSFKGEVPREMTIDEIHAETEQFAKSAKMAMVTGIDGIEIHAAHGYLLHSFLSPRFNKRTDMYGGSLENRMRFTLEVIRATRAAVGSKFVVGLRATSDEHMPGGLTIDEMKLMIKEFEKAGIDFFHITCGSYEAMNSFFPDEDGTELNDAKVLKAAVNIPILATSIHDPELADRAIREGMCDMILHARPLLADAEWANKVREDRVDDIVKCQCCLTCLTRLFQGLPSICPQNPNLGKEKSVTEYWWQPAPANPPPCKAACPAGVDAGGYALLLSQGKFAEALSMVRQRVPLPGVLGKVCTHPCEAECTRNRVDEPVACASLKRFLAEYELETQAKEMTPAPRTKEETVAIVGAGPAGLTAAHDLVKMGYGVTIFEALPIAGGMLRVGIPEYRLPREILQTEINRIQKFGVEIKLNSPIGKDGLTLDGLWQQGYKAIFIAVGAHSSMKLDVPGEELQGVYHGVSFLKDVNLGKEVKVGQKVAIVGGGNVAVDAARVALRLGSKEVFIVYRRTREEMPAAEEEIEATEHEGVKIHYLAAPVRILGRDGKVTGMECIRMELGKPDASGRRQPIPIKGSEFTIEADMVIPAIGQAPDLTFLPNNNKFQVSPQGTFEVDSRSLATNIPGIFAGGDVVPGPATVIWAIAEGKRAAIVINSYLRGESLPPEEKPLPATVDDINLGDVEKNKRVVMPTLPVEERVRCFKEVNLGFTREMAVEEANRCLNCIVLSQLPS